MYFTCAGIQASNNYPGNMFPGTRPPGREMVFKSEFKSLKFVFISEIKRQYVTDSPGMEWGRRSNNEMSGMNFPLNRA